MDSREGPTEDSRRALAQAKHLYTRIGFGARVGSAGGPPSSSPRPRLMRRRPLELIYTLLDKTSRGPLV